MAASKFESMVVFRQGDNFISNDPQFNEAEYLEWLDTDSEETEETEEVEETEETEEPTEEPAEDESEDDSEDDSEEGVEDYEELNGKELKALAAERGVDISGLTKVGEVREALIAADAAQAEEN